MSLRSKQQSVPCPTCHAQIGKPCVYPDSGKPQRGIHGAREAAAFATCKVCGGAGVPHKDFLGIMIHAKPTDHDFNQTSRV